jgi:hypothetical protein
VIAKKDAKKSAAINRGVTEENLDAKAYKQQHFVN